LFFLLFAPPQQKLNHPGTGGTNENPPEWFTSYLETVSVFSSEF